MLFFDRNIISFAVALSAKALPGNIEFIACVLYAITQIF